MRQTFLVSLLFLACNDGPTGPLPTEVPPVEVLSVAVNTAGPLVMEVTIELDRVAMIDVDYWATASPRLRVTSRRTVLSHRVLLPRLLPNTEYDYEIRPVVEGSAATTGEFLTDTLPTVLADLSITATGQPTEPLTILSIRDPRGVVFVNGDGVIVWYWLSEHVPQATKKMPNGNFVFLDNTGGGLTIVGPDTQTQARLQPEDVAIGEERVHHDALVTDRNTLIFLNIVPDQVLASDTLWAGEEIREWNPATGTETVLWSSADFFSPATGDRGPRTRPTDWLHANALSYGPRGNLLVSFHFLDQIISIASDYQSIEWRLGGPNSTMTPEPDAIFSGQHTAVELSTNRVLMFDNGFARADGSRYSRALEVELDQAGNTARKVWEFRPTPDNYARVISSARRLANGNTVVAFGTGPGIARFSTGPVEVYEVTREGSIVWHLVIENYTSTMFRAEPLSDIAGEVVVN